MGIFVPFVWDHSETLDKVTQQLSEHESQVLEEVEAVKAVDDE